MTGPIRISPGSFGAASASGADSAAGVMLTKLGFAPPRNTDQPMSLHMLDGPLVFRAVVEEAARRLEGAGYEVEVDPRLRLSAIGEEALEVLADLRGKLDELADVVSRIDDLRELADVAAQMVTGAHNVADGTRELLRTAAGSARDTHGPPHEREEIAGWFDAGAEAVATLQRNASNVPYPQQSDTSPAARAPAARTATTAPVSTTSALPHGPYPRRTRA
ncbi:hypothetical protein [Kitasatospora sp. NPDC001095]